MKKRLPIGISTVVVVALACTACGTTNESAGTTAAGSSSHAVKKILFDYPYTALPVYSALTPLIQAYAKQKGVTVELTSDNSDLANQVSNLNSYLSSDVDAVVSFPVDPASLETIAQNYISKGKYWITYAGDMKNQSATLQFSFEKSGEMLGKQAAQWANQHLGGQGKVLIIEDQTTQIGRERTAGLVQGLKQAAPNLTIVAQQQGVSPSQGLSVTSAVVSQHPDVNIVLTAVGDAAQGAYQALVQAGRSETDPKTYVGGLDANLFELQKMKAGYFLRGTVTVDVQGIVDAVVDIPLALAKGDKNASKDLPVELITKDDGPQIDSLIKAFGG